MFCTMEAAVKALPPGMPITTVLFFRYLFGTVVIAPAFMSARKSLDRKLLSFGVLRGILAMASSGCFFSAIRLIPLAEASTLLFFSPIFSLFLSRLILKEHFSRYCWGSVALSASGVLVIFLSLQEPTGSTSYLGVALSLCSAFIFSLMLVVSKIQASHPVKGELGADMTVVGVQSLTGLLITALLFSGAGDEALPNMAPLMKLLVAGAAGTAGLILLAMSFRKGEMSNVSLYQFSGLLWATAYGYFLFGENPSLPLFIGMGLITSAIVFKDFAIPRIETRVHGKQHLSCNGD